MTQTQTQTHNHTHTHTVIYTEAVPLCRTDSPLTALPSLPVDLHSEQALTGADGRPDC